MRRPVYAKAVMHTPVAVTEQPIARFIRVTGTLTAEEQADVAAETSGRVVSTPVERGTRVGQGTELIRLSAVETEASVKEAEANAAQIEARLAQPATTGFDVSKVPEVANARASLALAEAEFARIEKLESGWALRLAIGCDRRFRKHLRLEPWRRRRFGHGDWRLDRNGFRRLGNGDRCDRWRQ